ncbi:MAG: AAA family ATPase [Acidobacteriota bacterium]|nr:MAG: AAA family ATPase [Acidobacteriota bacterium]
MTKPDRLMAAFLKPDSYRLRVTGVQEVGFTETHISRVYFVGDRVYKVKKPVDFGFLDFTTLERRPHFCEQEVVLNRRLAAEVYLGVLPIVEQKAGGFVVGGDGAAIEYAVEMKRLPADRMLDQLLERGEVDEAMMDELVRLLVDFHRRAATGEGVDEFGEPAKLRYNAEENFSQTEDFAAPEGRTGKAGFRSLSGQLHDFLSSKGRSFLDTHESLLQERVRRGKIREGHGDLHTGNICFTDRGVVAYDCIEFTPRFRCADVAAEIAFLAMDLDFKQFRSLSDYFVERYRSLAADLQLGQLIDYYKTYFSIVRAKVRSMAAGGHPPHSSEHESARLEAMSYFHLAAAYDLPPTLVLMCGPPLSGKSWLAERIARPFGAVVLKSDGGNGSHEGQPAARSQDALRDEALRVLGRASTVIVDASLARSAERERWFAAAARAGHPAVVVWVQCDEKLIRGRLATRSADARAGSTSFDELMQGFEPPAEIPSTKLVTAASGQEPAEEIASRLIDRLVV